MGARRLTATVGAIATVAAAVGAAAAPAAAVPLHLPIVVNNTNDTGAGSLRAAIDRANAVVGPDTISFAIPGAGPHVITPLTDLPAVTNAVTIDGYTQPGAAKATKGDRHRRAPDC